MPATSKTQQRLMGLALAYKRKDISPAKLNPGLRSKVKKLAKSMTLKQLKDFAKTKHDKIPERVSEKLLNFEQFLIEKNLE